ncbi:hypothetical protein [Sinorhizobium meliloti]|uniref:hypothetical protein n=1 Tax=Rhizobium meliloti TaxID=382 RepID=UPI0004842D34|nr:hypothetical protein [Sinorhizobium meliloti]UFX07695.1 hypothetical protein SmelRRI128_14680 [Sinorhizobium meliloti]
MKKPKSADPKATKRQAILDEAKRQSQRLIDAQPPKWKRSTRNYEQIQMLSLALLDDQTRFIRPDAAALHRFATLGEMPFKAVQTLKNRYRDMIRIWTNAHDRLVALALPEIMERSDKARFKAVNVDPHIQSLEDIIRVLYNENIDLRAQLASSDPIVSPAATPEHFHAHNQTVDAEYTDLRPVRGWIADLEKRGSFLEVSDAGVKVSANARPGVIVMRRDVLQTLKAL